MTDNISVDIVENTPISVDAVQDTPISVEIVGTNSPGRFISLTDVPSTYSEKGGYFVKVNEEEDGLDFFSSSVVVNWGDISGTLSNQTDLQNELNLKEDLSNKTISTSLGTSNTLYPTQNAVKGYVDDKIDDFFDTNNLFVGANKKIYLDKTSDTYLIYNSTSHQLEVYVDGNIVQSFG